MYTPGNPHLPSHLAEHVVQLMRVHVALYGHIAHGKSRFQHCRREGSKWERE